MRRDLIDKAERDRLAYLRAKRGEDAAPVDGGAASGLRVGRSGVAHVTWFQRDHENRARPWQARTAGDRYIATVATAAEGAAVVDAWRHISAVAGDRADVKSLRKTAKRIAADFMSGQAVLPLGDGLEGWLDPEKPE